MKTALALQLATFSRSATARVATFALVLLPPFFSVGMVAIARAPGLDGATAVKLAPYAEGDFAEAAAMLAGQVTSAAAFICVGFASAWLVGREWSDRTLGSLFALPISRRDIAWAKLAVLATWSVISLALAMTATAGAVAIAGGGTFSAQTSAQLGRVWLAGIVMSWLALGAGWVAVKSRGFLGAVGVIVAVTAASQILASLGLGAWVPYVAPALWAGAGGEEAAATVSAAAIIAAVAFAGFGAWATARAFGAARLD